MVTSVFGGIRQNVLVQSRFGSYSCRGMIKLLIEKSIFKFRDEFEAFDPIAWDVGDTIFPADSRFPSAST
jgi:hypothetical protein